MKREIPLFLTAVIGAIVLAGFFVPHEIVSVPADFLQRCAVIVVAFGYALGGANVVRVNLEGIVRRDPDWPYKVVLLLGLFVTLVFGLFVDRARFQEPGTVSLWIYDHVYVPMNSTMFALLAFFIASAAFRAFRVRSTEAGLLAVSALIVMVGRVPIGDAIMRAVFDHPGLPDGIRELRLEPLQQWIMDWPQNAAKRAILIGAAMGVMATGLRVMLGIERSYLGGAIEMNLRSLEKLDRRWLFLIVGLLVLAPLVRPLGLPLTPTAPVRQYHDAIAAIPDGSTVLMSCDYDPASTPELDPMTRTSLRQLWDKRCKVVVTVLWNGGAAIVDQAVEEVASEYRARGVALVDGVDYVNLGYKSGNEAVMVLMGQGIASAFPRDHRGRVTAQLPIMRDVGGYSSFPLLVNISAGYPGTKEWVQQVNARFHLPMVSGCTAVSAPEFFPYLQSGQLRGMLGGMAGAAEYELLRRERGAATAGMDAQSLVHLFVALCIVLGNLVQRTKSGGGAS